MFKSSVMSGAYLNKNELKKKQMLFHTVVIERNKCNYYDNISDVK